MKPIENQDRHETTVQLLWSLVHNSCLSSCTILTAISEQQQKYSYTDRVVNLYFNDIVQDQTTVLSYGFDSLVVEVPWVSAFHLLTTVVEKLVKWKEDLIIDAGFFC